MQYYLIQEQYFKKQVCSATIPVTIPVVKRCLLIVQGMLISCMGEHNSTIKHGPKLAPQYTQLQPYFK